MIYSIIEVANTHGGDIKYLKDLILDFKDINKNVGIKFQPLHPDKLSTKDYEWHEVYKQLFFNHKEWTEIISLAKSTNKDVWIDIFDEYGIEVIKANSDAINGIKLQASVLFNYRIFEILKDVDLIDKKLIINVAALEEKEISFFLSKFEKWLNPKEILIEVGFQGYPTELMDSGLSKIKVIKSKFNKRVVFADHVDGKSDYALILPLMAAINGADVIEKHVMLSDRETKYDFHASITSSQFSKMVDYIDSFDKLNVAPFINQKEKEYLDKSIMKPILAKPKSKGEGLDLLTDFEYKRSNQEGLNSREIEKLLESFHILSSDKSRQDTLNREDFKKANIAVIVACRLKSSRLKQKALLKIGDLSSVEFCLKNACRFKDVSQIILATSDLSEDGKLKDYTYKDSVEFVQGDPEDVIQRYLDATNRFKIDVVIRVTADMPFIDSEICDILLKSHFSSGADYTAATTAAVGTNLEIINTQALQRVKDYFPSAYLSEYMTWYFTNNSEYFKLNFVELPDDLVRDYRLTLDFQEDLEMFNKIHNTLFQIKKDYGIRDVFKFLDDNKEVAAINNHISLKYKTDLNLIALLNEKTKIK